MTDFYKLVDERQSDRGYDTERSVPREVVMRIVDAARRAPSACNSQPWHFIVVDKPELCAEVADALTSIGMNKFASQAPCFIVLVQEAPNFTARLGGWIKNKHFPPFFEYSALRTKNSLYLYSFCRLIFVPVLAIL